ncbi:MAG: ribonuclease H [Flavobacteriales bacterium]|nr:ribonuclease H [Flavobacteriales bacterium]
MAKKKNKYYVVWEGHVPGVYHTWAECQQQTSGYADARFRSFDSLEEAEKAFQNPELVLPKKKKKPLYYVVWEGLSPGIYTDWDSAKKQIEGATRPKYKAFGSKMLAETAYEEGPDKYEGRGFKKTRDLSQEELDEIGLPIPESISVDAASNAKTGVFEYRGVITDSGTEVFKVGPLREGSNNIGEFLALVHALAYLKKSRSSLPIYSDSRIAMGWVKNGKARPKKAGAKARALIRRAEAWLKNNDYDNPIWKWHTKVWGEIPADFGRK